MKKESSGIVSILYSFVSLDPFVALVDSFEMATLEVDDVEDGISSICRFLILGDVLLHHRPERRIMAADLICWRLPLLGFQSGGLV